MSGTEINISSKAPAAGDALNSGGRLRRLIHGWSANLVQILLVLVQQLLLIPVFLHFWTSDALAAWLAIYAAGSLIVVADAGLQLRAINRFLAFKSSVDCDGRTASFYSGMLQIYFGLVIVLGALLLIATRIVPPSAVLGFHATVTFDSALLVMILGMLLVLPSNLVSGLYRARGRYGRAVWLQNLALLLGQIAQIVAVAVFGHLLAVAVAFVSTQVLLAFFLVVFDAPRLFPYLRRGGDVRSWRWSIGQFGPAFPFAVANLSELAIVNAPVLLVSAFVTDRELVAQWGLTRVVAGLVRGLCTQIALPIAAELGHDYAIGDKDRLRRIYSLGSVIVTATASLMVAGLLPFWPDFFSLWTRGNIPYDASLAIILLLGSVAVAPSLLALAFANYSDRRDLLVRSKGSQLVVFLALSFILIPRLGPIGAACAIVVSDFLVQFGLLALMIMGQTLRHPFRHAAFLAAVALTIVVPGWSLGGLIASLLPAAGFAHFIAKCAIWLIAVGLVASPLLSERVRGRLMDAVPT